MSRFIIQLPLVLFILCGTSPALWAQAGKASPRKVKVLVVYYSRTGNTEVLAKAVAEGVERTPDAAAVVKKVADVTKQDVQSADGLILGSPTYFANMAGPLKEFIDRWSDDFKPPFFDKVGGAFATGASRTGGKELVVVSMLMAMMNNGMIIVGPHYEAWGTFGASALTEPPGVEPNEEEDARKLGERVASVAQRLRYGPPGK